MAAEKRPTKRLIQRIRALLASGILLSPDLIHTIRSIHSDPFAGGLQAILDDPDDADNAPLCQLIFSPGPAMQMKLEDLLARHRFTAGDAAAVRDALADDPPPTLLFTEDDRIRLVHPMPFGCVDGFVAGLNLCRHAPKAIADAIDCRMAPAHRTAARVALRNARVGPSPGTERFLCRFLASGGPDPDGFLALFRYLLSVLEEMPADQDPFDWLSRKKAAWVKALDQAEKFAAHLRCNNVETLMLRGVRPAAVDSARARRNIGRIDRICRMVFGRIPETPIVDVGFPAGWNAFASGSDEKV